MGGEAAADLDAVLPEFPAGEDAAEHAEARRLPDQLLTVMAGKFPESLRGAVPRDSGFIPGEESGQQRLGGPLRRNRGAERGGDKHSQQNRYYGAFHFRTSRDFSLIL